MKRKRVKLIVLNKEVNLESNFSIFTIMKL